MTTATPQEIIQEAKNGDAAAWQIIRTALMARIAIEEIFMVNPLREALMLIARKHGASGRAIGEAFGIDHKTALKAVRRAMSKATDI